MAKIIKIAPPIVSLGTDDGAIAEVSSDCLNFVPHIGDEVEVFQTGETIIVSKLERGPVYGPCSSPDGGYRISPPLQAQNQVGQQVYYQAPVFVTDGKVVNKSAYCLLALFLGWLGMHKFYAGQVGRGIAFLLFSWTGIPFVISLFNLIGALLKKADFNGNIVV